MTPAVSGDGTSRSHPRLEPPAIVPGCLTARATQSRKRVRPIDISTAVIRSPATRPTEPVLVPWPQTAGGTDDDAELDQLRAVAAKCAVLERVTGVYEEEWQIGTAGAVFAGISAVLESSRFDEYQVRSVSALGALMLVTGRSRFGDIDAVLTRTGLLLVIDSTNGPPVRRAITERERADLSDALEAFFREPRTGRRALLRTVLEATTRTIFDLDRWKPAADDAR